MSDEVSRFAEKSAEIEGRRLGDAARLNTSLQAMQDWLKAAAENKSSMRL